MLSKEEIDERIKYAKSNFTDGIEILLEIIEQLEQENNKKNKIIDEMVKYLAQDIRCIRPEIECNKMTHDCRICVKQYFEKKVED